MTVSNNPLPIFNQISCFLGIVLSILTRMSSFELHEEIKNLKIEKNSIKLKQDWLPEDYHTVVDESILNIKFSPDIFQKQAFYLLSTNNSVFVSAHTSSGKTLVAEYAIQLSIKNSTRVIYTSPIKALSNQKFFDFKQKFPDVGLITGDIQVNPNAKCLIMTTEILRNLVYKNSDILRDTSFVVFDEVHYINDSQRGVIWEECIIMLPKHINLVMLSATIPNSLDFAEWVGRTKERCVYVISTNKRAVPLEFAIYCDSNVFSIDNTFNKNKIPSNFKTELTPYSKKIRTSNKFRINDLGNFINNRRLMPAIFFTFSKKTCEEYGKSLQLLDLTTPSEKQSILKFIDLALSNLREEDKNLPQIRSMQEQAYRGVAIHHGSLLPFVKECVEILFSENLIKILVATETFAMGINMPAKCCVFLSLTKIDNERFRYLNTGEFIQMSGRAGRRGMDQVGTVIIADQRMPDPSIIKNIILGIPDDLNSHFKLSFSLILMALISNVEVEDLMRSSFRENDSHKSLKADMTKLIKLESLDLLSCDACADYSDFLNDLLKLSKEMPIILKRILKVKDIVILKNNAIVEVSSVTSSGFRYTQSSVKLNHEFLFQDPVDDNLRDIYLNNKDDDLLMYPIPCVEKCIGEFSEFDNALFLVKDSNISFITDETDANYICKSLEMKKIFEQIMNYSCIRCKHFKEHYIEAIRSKNILDEIERIRNKHSRENLLHINEYSSRIEFLKKYNFIDSNITLKGRVASEIRTVNEVLVTELIFNNEIDSFTPFEVIAVFSAMICEDKQDEYEISPELQAKVNVLERYYNMFNDDLENMGIPKFEILNLGMVQPVFDWCNGVSLGNIVARHKVQEGTFVRLLLRLDECCREMINISSIIGDEKISDKFSQASISMKRDIVFLPSLYI